MDLGRRLCYAASMPRDIAHRFFLQTLGCKVNQYESRALAEAWERAGLLPAATPDQADLVVLCTCTVTARAEAESRRLTRGLVREAAPGARVVVTGCAAAVKPQVFAGLGAIPVPDKAALARCPLAPPVGPADPAYPDLAVSGYDRARALLKIEDGCSHGCAFCIVPTARGPSRSRPVADILAEARRLAAAGHGELGLTGINLGHFGRDLSPALTLWDLVALLDKELGCLPQGSVRLRLGSLDPAVLTEQGVDVLSRSRLVCPHLHISLQSGDPGVLTAMGRRATDVRAVSFFVDKISRVWPRFGLGLDLLAGFPGETEAAFAATAAVLTELPLTHAHVFPYSQRPGTRAATMPGQLPREVKAARAAKLRELARDKASRFRAAMAADGDAVTVALEGGRPAGGTCGQYVDCRFTAEPPGRPGVLVRARVVGSDDAVLLVTPEKEADRP